MRRYYATRWIVLLSFLCVATVISTCAKADSQDEWSYANGIWAKVNDEVLTYQDVKKAIQVQIDELTKTYREPELNKKIVAAASSYTKLWIERRLTLAEAKRIGLFVTSKEVEDLFEKAVLKVGSLEKYEEFLVSNGSTIEARKILIREELVIRAMGENITRNKVFVSPGEIKEYYKKNKNKYVLPERISARRIVLTDESGTPTDMQVDKILVALKEEQDFSVLAAKYSTLAQEAQRGGRMDLVVKECDQLPVVINTLFAMTAGEVRVVTVQLEETTMAMILCCDVKHPVATQPFKEVSGSISSKLMQAKRKKVIAKFIEEARAKYFVVQRQ